MLYCPKCNSNYEEGTQRFCTNDGLRLLPAPSVTKNQPKNTGVFSNIIAKASGTLRTGEEDESFSKAFPRVENRGPDLSALKADRVAQPGREGFREEFPLVGSAPPRPASRLIRPQEIPAGHAKLEDRFAAPEAPTTFDSENPGSLIGKTVKGRYNVREILKTDPSNIAFLAEDMIVKGRKVVIRVFTGETRDDQISKILAEERVSLSHVNHPNVASLLDSGELTGGKPFIITEFIHGKTVRELLDSGAHFTTLRVARIVRQVASALGEAHENAILHRSLKPENIILSVSSAGTEQVTVTGFAVYRGTEKVEGKDLYYRSPEQLEGGFSTFASDIYGLATIAYQMLTSRLPFVGNTKNELLKAQKEGLTLPPTNLRLELPVAVDEVLEKALASNPLNRFAKARDFGEAFFNALMSSAVPAERARMIQDLPAIEKSKPALRETPAKFPLREHKTRETSVPKKVPLAIEEKPRKIAETHAKPASIPLWEKRSFEFGDIDARWRTIFVVAGIAILLGSLYGLWWFLSSRSALPGLVTNQPAANLNVVADANSQSSSNNTAVIESTTATGKVPSPTDYIRFENSKETLKGDLAKNFRGFTLFYPSSWSRSSSTTNFLDIKRSAPSGTPIEQMLVSYYSSKGTFEADRKEFPGLVKKANETLGKLISGYKFLSQSEQTLNGSWKAYEMKFEGSGTTRGGEKVKLWGRRIFVPPMRRDAKSGIVITMVATSLSPEIASADDIGNKGELAKILESFEPETHDIIF